jgi:Cdc6-like AAA superfamily ATPase
MGGWSRRAVEVAEDDREDEEDEGHVEEVAGEVGARQVNQEVVCADGSRLVR